MNKKLIFFFGLVFFSFLVSSQISEVNLTNSGGFASGDNATVSSGGGNSDSTGKLTEELSRELGEAVERQIQGIATEEDLALIEEYKVDVQITEGKINQEESFDSINLKFNILIWILVLFGLVILILLYLLLKKKESKTILVS